MHGLKMTNIVRAAWHFVDTGGSVGDGGWNDALLVLVGKSRQPYLCRAGTVSRDNGAVVQGAVPRLRVCLRAFGRVTQSTIRIRSVSI